jgi:hypothetical protein
MRQQPTSVARATNWTVQRKLASFHPELPVLRQRLEVGLIASGDLRQQRITIEITPELSSLNLQGSA